MGDRGSISVKDSCRESVVLFRHWGGSPGAMKELVNETWNRFVVDIKDQFRSYANRGAEEVIAALTCVAVESDGYSAYLGRNHLDGDNSDNGHFFLHIESDSLCFVDNKKPYAWSLEYGDCEIGRWEINKEEKKCN